MSTFRSTFGVLFSVSAWSIVFFVLFHQFIWIYAACIAPHFVLADKLGRAAWTSPTVKYSSFMGFDYDEQVWRLAISQALADELKLKCENRAILDDLDSVLRDVVVEPDVTKNPAGAQRPSPKSGCVIYRERIASQNTSIEIVLADRTLQVEVLNK